MNTTRSLAVFGATGTIGVNTLDVVRRHRDRLSVYALTAKTNDERLAEQCFEFEPRVAVMVDERAAERLAGRLEGRLACEVRAGAGALEEVAANPAVDTVMAAIVGGAGLGSSLAAARAGKRVLLANKESLVMSGRLFMGAVRESGAELLPIDSEHNAIFQCMPGAGDARGPGPGPSRQGVRRVLLTGSGGPFRCTPLDELPSVTPEQAVAHPNWIMGRKISVDSATMMNKGLELIEACWLFDTDPDHVEVVVHPQSVIHSMVEYVDGSVLAQLGNPDMRTPIAHALGWPERIESGVEALDFMSTGPLEFEPPDFERFPCLHTALEVARAGPAASTVLNAANEVAVAAFLDRRLGYTDISNVIASTLEAVSPADPANIEDVLAIDAAARAEAEVSAKLRALS
ncbi:MAG: 1-deoxy-D-xylulose-5-phosphate reductoisomerase [Gammaproteobacteria bacterium]